MQWNWSLLASGDTILAKLKNRFNDRVRMNKKSKKNKFCHDSDVGQYIIEQFGYNDVPWSFNKSNVGPADYDEDATVTRSDDVSVKIKNFTGNFSVIIALGEPCNLGIVHGSHRGPEKREGGLFHQGSTSLIQIPDRCMIICHGNMSHYGPRAQFNTYTFRKNIRSFAYMNVKGYKFETDEVTHSEDTMWCELKCEKCKDVRTTLEDEKCDNDMVWESDKDVEMLDPGEFIMGDIHTLGWVIIKSYQYVGLELKGYYKELMNIVGTKTPFHKWNTIQHSEKNEMKSNHFIAHEPHSELFAGAKGKIMMKITRKETV